MHFGRLSVSGRNRVPQPAASITTLIRDLLRKSIEASRGRGEPLESRAPGGASGTLALGWGAGENEAADADGIFAAIPGNAAADLTFDLSSSTAAKNKRFSEEVDLILSASVISGGWSGDLVEVELEYIID